MKHFYSFFIANLIVISLTGQDKTHVAPSFHSVQKQQVIETIENSKNLFRPDKQTNVFWNNIEQADRYVSKKKSGADILKDGNQQWLALKNKTLTTKSGNILKSAATQKYCLDSVVFSSWNDSLAMTIRLEKQHFKYKSNGLTDSYIGYEWDMPNKRWASYFKTENGYNAKDQLILETSYYWEEKWVLSDKYEYNYDESGNRILETRYDWNKKSDKWIGDYKYERSFDMNVNETFYLEYDWDTIAGTWINRIKAERSFNAKGQELSTTSYTWDRTGKQWIGNMKEVSAYDDNSGVRIGYSQYYWNKETSQWISLNQNVKNANLLTTFYVYFEWNETSGKWVGELKYEALFNSQGKVASETEYKWDTLNNCWINDWKVEYAYDTNGNNSSTTELEWNRDTNSWIYTHKLEKSFDSKMNISLTVLSDWNTATNQWINTSKTESTYNSLGHETLRVQYNWDTDKKQWVGDNKGMYSYDITGNMILYVKYIWDDASNGWINYSKAEEETDSNGNPIMQSRYLWDQTLGIWVGQSKEESTYNTSNYPVTMIEYGWDSITNNWIPKEKTETVLTDDDEMVSEKIYNWDSTENKWKDYFGIELTYDYSHKTDDLLLPNQYSNSSIFHHMLMKYNYYGYIEDDYIFTMNIVFHYSKITLTGINQYTDGTVQVFPNPASDKLTFKWNDSARQLSLTIYNTNGKIVLQDFISNNSTVPINNLSGGMYIYRLTNDGQPVSTGKISVK